MIVAPGSAQTLVKTRETFVQRASAKIKALAAVLEMFNGVSDQEVHAPRIMALIDICALQEHHVARIVNKMSQCTDFSFLVNCFEREQRLVCHAVLEQVAKMFQLGCGDPELIG